MRITRRGFASLAASALCARVPRAAEPIHIMTPAGHSFMPAHFAAEHGLYAKHGIAAEVSLTTNPPSMLPAVVAGTLQIGATSAVQLVVGRENGLDLVAVAGGNLQLRTHPGTAVIVAANGPLHAPADFKGRKIVTPGLNGSFHVLFLHWLSAEGVDPASVQCVEAGYAQMGDLLRGGSVDGALLVEPFISSLMQSGQWRRIEYFQMSGRDYAYDAFLIASRPWTARNPDQVTALRAAWADACEVMNADPAAARATEARVLKLNPDVLARLELPPYQTRLEAADVQLWIKLCKERGLISKDQAAADLIA
jgi:NitT/TauT family transport system substrate-binding protein